jgi:hypothetical protein
MKKRTKEKKYDQLTGSVRNTLSMHLLHSPSHMGWAHALVEATLCEREGVQQVYTQYFFLDISHNIYIYIYTSLFVGSSHHLRILYNLI